MITNLKKYIIFINIIIFLILPYNLANVENEGYNYNVFLSILIICISFSIFTIFFFYFLIKIFKNFNINIYKYIEIFIKFSLLWFFIIGIFFPVTGEHDAFLNLNVSIKGKYIILSKFFLVIILFYFFEKYKASKFIFKFIIIYIIINLLLITSKIDFNFDTEKLEASKINKFGNKNLIVLSFDGISDVKMFDEIQNNRELKRNLKDFIFFKDVVSAGPFTKASLNAEITGNLENFNNPELNFDNILNDKNLDVSVYNTYYHLVSDKKNTLQEGEYKNYSNNYELNKFLKIYFLGSVGRWGTYLSIPIVEKIFYKDYYKKFTNIISFNKINQIDPFKKIDTPSQIGLFEFDLIFNEINLDKNLENVIRMFHFSFSHWPVNVNENCEEVEFLENADSNDHESIVIKCISQKIITFLSLIKKNKIYNNSMIVIKSDHGKPNYVELIYNKSFIETFTTKTYNNYYSNYPYNLKINDSFYWGYGRYKPFLMIKNSNTINEELKTSDKQVFIHDLSATYCNFFYNKNRCTKYNRNNLIENENLFKSYNYDIILPINKYSFQNLNHFEIDKIKNTKPLLDFLLEKKFILNDK